MDFCSLQHLQVRMGRFFVAGLSSFPRRAAHRVWLPSRRLTPTRTGPAVFQTDSAPGIHPAKLSPPATSLIAFLRPAQPTYRSCRAYCRRRLGRQPAARPAVPGFSLPASLAFERVFSAIGDAGCFLGLCPFGACTRWPGRDFAQSLRSRVLRERIVRPDPADASAYLSAIAGCRRSSSGRCTGDTTLIGFLHRFGPDHLNEPDDPSYVFT
jgi:hypothetical protein